MSLAKRSAFEKRAFLPSGSGDPWAIPTNGSLAAVTTAGIPVTEQMAMSLLSVHACVRIIANTVANLPFRSMRVDENEIYTPVPNQPTIIKDPFGGLSLSGLPKRREGLKQVLISVMLRGNAYLLVTARDSSGRPLRIRVLHPDRVSVAWGEDGVRVYKVDRKEVPADNIIHVIGLSFPESPKGMSVIECARNAIGLGLAAEMYGGRFFGEGAHLTGVIEIEADFDKEKARTLKETFQATHGGVQNSHTVGVLTGGAKWVPISVAPEDAQFLGTRAAQDLNIAMLFGVPPHMLMQVDKTTSWGTGIEQQSMGFTTYTLTDYLCSLEEAWTPMLPGSQLAMFDESKLLRTDEAGRYAVYSVARSGAILTTNEIRRRENMPPIEGGDDIAAPLNSNVKPLKDNQAKKSQATADDLGAVL